MNISIKKNGIHLSLKSFVFPAGEIGVKLNANNYKYLEDKSPYQTITARIYNSNELVELLMVRDALKRISPIPTDLFLPYLPYSRQDRVCDKGESFSLKVLADLVNQANFRQVITLDAHSHVADALFTNLKNISQLAIIHQNQSFIERVMRGGTFVSADAGANKKTAEIAKYFGHFDFVRADKARNLRTGEIIETVVYKDDFGGEDVFIVDDICDGGATFIALAQALKKKNCGKIVLYVTHGIFSKGTEILFENRIDEIWTTNSYARTGSDFNVMDIQKVLDAFYE